MVLESDGTSLHQRLPVELRSSESEFSVRSGESLSDNDSDISDLSALVRRETSNSSSSDDGTSSTSDTDTGWSPWSSGTLNEPGSSTIASQDLEEVVKDTGGESDDDDWDVIKLDDEEDRLNRMQNRDPSKEMICLRCYSAPKRFKDKEKYLFHITRHVFCNHYCCPTCGRPFLKLNHCVSHEIRVHGTTFKPNIFPKDAVVAYARNYKKYKDEKKARVIIKEDGVDVVDLDAEESDDGEETDCEDTTFYENHIVASNALVRYRGPPVTHILQCYQIHLKFSHKKTYAHPIAKHALECHQRNLAFGFDVDRISAFSARRKQPLFIPPDQKRRKRPRSPDTSEGGESVLKLPPKKTPRIELPDTEGGKSRSKFPPMKIPIVKLPRIDPNIVSLRGITLN